MNSSTLTRSQGVDQNFKQKTLKLLNDYHNRLKILQNSLPKNTLQKQIRALSQKFVLISKQVFSKILQQILKQQNLEIRDGPSTLQNRIRLLTQQVQSNYASIQKQFNFTLQDSFTLGDFSHQLKQKVDEYQNIIRSVDHKRLVNIRLQESMIEDLVRSSIQIKVNNKSLDQQNPLSSGGMMMSEKMPNLMMLNNNSSIQNLDSGVMMSRLNSQSEFSGNRYPGLGQVINFKRFKSFDQTKEWTTQNWDAIKFTTKQGIRLLGFVSFRHKYDKMGGLLYRLIVNRRDVFGTKQAKLWKNIKDKHITEIFFENPIEIAGESEFHIITLHENAKMEVVKNATYCGKFPIKGDLSSGSAFIDVQDSHYDQNGTNFEVGQIPEIMFLPLDQKQR